MDVISRDIDYDGIADSFPATSNININNITCDTYNTFVRINKIDGNYTFSSYLGCKNKGQERVGDGLWDCR